MNTGHNALPIQAGFVFIGIAVVLVLAMLLGMMLHRRFPEHPAVIDWNARVGSWRVMLLVLLCAFWFDRFGAVFLFLLISFAALREFMTLVYRRRGDHNVIAACFYVLLPLQYYFVLTAWYSMFAALIPVYAFLILPIIGAFSGDTVGLFDRTAKIQWGAMITIFCLSHVPAIMYLHIQGFEEQNILLLMFMIVVAQSSDAIQYGVGMLWGKRKLVPSLSDKTVLGSIMGIGLGTALAAGLFWLTPFSPIQAAAIGLLICVMGLCGSVVMSGIKRSYGVRSWGRMMHGKVGMLDRVESICFAAPVFFHVVRYYWV